MSKNRLKLESFPSDVDEPGESGAWSSGSCEYEESLKFSWPSARASRSEPVQVTYSPDWITAVPALIEKLAASVSEKKQQELRINLLEILVNELRAKVHRLESIQPKIVPINTFAPEPYELLRPICVAVQSIEGGFNAGWFDANIHSSGENEAEAVSNLKSLILDFYDGLHKEPAETLGPEPKRQIAVLSEFIKKRS